VEAALIAEEQVAARAILEYMAGEAGKGGSEWEPEARRRKEHGKGAFPAPLALQP
jgi:hypothetical protein